MSPNSNRNPLCQGLLRLFRSEPKCKRKCSSDWGADELGSFCRPDAEEYSWNWNKQSKLTNHKPDHAHDTTKASNARRQHEGNTPRFKRLRGLFRSKPKRKRTGGSDWGADGAGSFCKPDAEEWSWNWKNPCQWINHKYGVTLTKPTPHDETAVMEKKCWKELTEAEHAIHEHRAMMEPEYHSGSDEDERSARWHRRLVREEIRILRLREDLHRIAPRQSENEGRFEMRGALDGGHELLGDGIDDEEGGDADDEDGRGSVTSEAKTRMMTKAKTRARGKAQTRKARK